MPYDSAQDICNDALFRAGEIPGASEWDQKVLDYLNRVHQAICSGASELLPEFIEDWWWLRANGVLTINPTVTGTALVIQNNNQVNLSVDPGTDLTGRRLRIGTHPDIFIITTHAGTIVLLDSPYTGPGNASISYEALQVVYNLSGGVAAIMSPIVSFRDNPQIMGVSPERLDTLWPLSRLRAGVPQAFALETETQIRFSHGGRSDGLSMRMEFRYRPVVDDLVNLSNSFPLLPRQWRHLLSDAVTMYLMLDKNDDRATSVGQAARAGLSAMARENRRRVAKMDRLVGKILPRQSSLAMNQNRIRTESGFIIG